MFTLNLGLVMLTLNLGLVMCALNLGLVMFTLNLLLVITCVNLGRMENGGSGGGGWGGDGGAEHSPFFFFLTSIYMQVYKDTYLPVTLICAQKLVLKTFHSYSSFTDRQNITISHVCLGTRNVLRLDLKESREFSFGEEGEGHSM